MPQAAAHGKEKLQAATHVLMQCQTLLVLHALFISSQAQKGVKLQKLHKQQLN